MKLVSLAIFLLLAQSAFARPVAPGKGQCVYRDLSSSNVPAAFGSAGAELFTGLSNSQSFEVYNTSSTPLFGCSTSSTTNCTGCAANFAVPANGYYTAGKGDVFIGAKICLAGAPGTAVTSGTVVSCVR